MGILSSKPYHTDPAGFATKAVSATEEVTPNDYKTYDYIIVGAGELRGSLGGILELMGTCNNTKAPLDVSWLAGCRKTRMSLSY